MYLKFRTVLWHIMLFRKIVILFRCYNRACVLCVIVVGCLYHSRAQCALKNELFFERSRPITVWADISKKRAHLRTLRRIGHCFQLIVVYVLDTCSF